MFNFPIKCKLDLFLRFNILQPSLGHLSRNFKTLANSVYKISSQCKKKERKTRDAVISVVFARCFCCCRRGTLHAFHFNLISAAFCFHLAPAKGHLASWQLRLGTRSPGLSRVSHVWHVQQLELCTWDFATALYQRQRHCHCPSPWPFSAHLAQLPRPAATFNNFPKYATLELRGISIMKNPTAADDEDVRVRVRV